MIQWDELSEEEQGKLTEVATDLAIVTGDSTNATLGVLLEVLDAEISRASRIPAHLFEPTEKVASRPMSIPGRFRWK